MVIGPLCRRVDDVMPILRVLAGPDGRDPACQKMPLRDPETVKISSLRIFSWPGGGAVKVRPVMREAVDLCAAALRSEGARDRVLSGHDLESGFVLWMSALQAANPDGYEKVVAGEGGIPILRELLLYPLGRSRFVLPTLVTMLSESIVRRLPIGFASFLQRLDRLREELDAQLGEDGVILHPPYSRPAPRHKLALLTPFDAECTALFNVLGYAVTVVPVGFDEEGLPVSVQVISRRGNDHLTLAAARVIERHFGGWRRAMK
jgi:fatty acid amide hydrolase 2